MSVVILQGGVASNEHSLECAAQYIEERLNVDKVFPVGLREAASLSGRRRRLAVRGAHLITHSAGLTEIVDRDSRPLSVSAYCPAIPRFAGNLALGNMHILFDDLVAAIKRDGDTRSKELMFEIAKEVLIPSRYLRLSRPSVRL